LNLEGVLVDDVPVSARTKIKLPHDYKKIEFRYTAMSFIAPEEVCFKRRLSGFDEGWVEDGRSRGAAYPRLPPGDYEFQFTACNNDGVWNNAPYRFGFQVVPAFWQTTWFHASEALAFTGLVGGGVLLVARVRMRRKLARLEQAHVLERERRRISRDLHDNLGARATKISVLAAAASRSVELPETSRQLHDVSQSARQLVRALDETVWTVNPGNDSLANLLDYVTHYAEEFFSDTPVRCQLKIPVDVGDRPMSPELRHSLLAIIKESLNNVLKHSGARNVVVAAQVAGNSLAFTIRDDGCGFLPKAQVSGNGLANLRARAAAIGARIEIQSQPGKGTTLRVEVPELNLGFIFPKEA
jgi:signal transduction histidine kinase